MATRTFTVTVTGDESELVFVTDIQLEDALNNSRAFDSQDVEFDVTLDAN